MTPFPELAASREYWLTKIQNELYAHVEEYLEEKSWTRTQFAQHLDVSKGYVSQILNGDFDHKLSKLIDLSLAVGMVPNLRFQQIADYVEDYMSGYDGCLRADKVHITMNVVNTAPPRSEDYYSDFVAASTHDLHDNEVETKYSYSAKAYA
jgi:transcriptional regulator with XRE-family HTH domain